MNSIIKKICQLAKSGEREIQFSALRVLAHLNVRDREAIRLLGEMLQKVSDSGLRDLILDISAKTGLLAYLPYLIACLSDVSFNREKVIHAITSLGANTIPALEKRYPKASDYEKQSILMVFARIPTRKSINLLVNTLLDNQQVERLKLVCGLLKEPIEHLQRSDRAWLKRLLLHQMKRPQVKKNNTLLVSHLILLGYLRDPSTKTLLLKLLNESADFFVKKYALIALAQLQLAGKGHEDVFKGLIPTLSHPDYPNIVKNAISVLERFEISKKMQAEISKLLENPHSSVRSFALSKLGTFESGENVATLIGYLDSGDHRIKDAAQNSLEKMPKAAKVLLGEFEKSNNPDKMNQIISILKHHKNYFTTTVARRLFVKMEKLLKDSHQIYRLYLILVRSINPDFLYKEVLGRCARLKKKNKWAQVIQYLGFLEGSFLFNDQARFELAVARIKDSKKDYFGNYRDQNQGLLLLQALVKTNGPKLYKQVLKEKALDTEDRYYVGFHFAEKLFELKEFGTKILKTLARGRSRIARLAKRKLAMVGSGSSVGVLAVA